MKIILLGAPGAGKGTQAEILCEKYNIPTISTGAIIRKAVADSTEMGLKAKKFMDEGRLVPDDVVIGIIKERLSENDCQSGFILDGFPRTVPQAKALDDMGVVLDKVVSIEVPDNRIIERMSGRRVCSCGATYHIEHKPSKDNKTCDVCGKELTIREDDKPETVLSRLEIYHDQTEPLKDYYQSKGKLVIAYGKMEIAETTAEVIKALEA